MTVWAGEDCFGTFPGINHVFYLTNLKKGFNFKFNRISTLNRNNRVLNGFIINSLNCTWEKNPLQFTTPWYIPWWKPIAIAVSPTDVFSFFLFQESIVLAHSLASIMDLSANLSHSTSVSFVSTTTDTTTTLGLALLLSS